MCMVSKKENNGAIKWTECGKGFTIVDKKQLEINVLGRYFRSSRYASFRRKLNRCVKMLRFKGLYSHTSI